MRLVETSTRDVIDWQTLFSWLWRWTFAQPVNSSFQNYPHPDDQTIRTTVTFLLISKSSSRRSARWGSARAKTGQQKSAAQSETTLSLAALLYFARRLSDCAPANWTLARGYQNSNGEINSKRQYIVTPRCWQLSQLEGVPLHNSRLLGHWFLFQSFCDPRVLVDRDATGNRGRTFKIFQVKNTQKNAQQNNVKPNLPQRLILLFPYKFHRFFMTSLS